MTTFIHQRSSVGYKFGASNAWRILPAESIQALNKVPSNGNIRLVNASALELAADLEEFGGGMMIGEVPVMVITVIGDYLYWWRNSSIRSRRMIFVLGTMPR